MGMTLAEKRQADKWDRQHQADNERAMKEARALEIADDKASSKKSGSKKIGI